MEDECARRGLTCTEAVALLHLSVRKLTVSEVSRAAGLQRSGGSVLVDRLHERKLVRRLPDTEDRRVMAVELTAAGRRLVTTLSRRLASQTRDLLAPVPVSQREHVISGLRILADLRE